MSKENIQKSQVNQKDNILMLNFVGDIPEKSHDFSNNQVEVNSFSVNQSIPDMENVINGKNPIAKRSKKIIITTHGSLKGKRKTKDEVHMCNVGEVNVPLNSMGNNRVKTEDLIKHLIKIYPDVEEIIINSCHAGSIRASDIPCTITALSPAKNVEVARESQAYIQWRIANYAKFKDPCAAAGAASSLFPTTKTLMYYDKELHDRNIFKFIAPKEHADIQNLTEFLYSTDLGMFDPKKSDKEHQRHNVQIRNINNSVNSVNDAMQSTSLKRIITAKKQIKLNEDAIRQYVQNAMAFNALYGNFDRVKQYHEYFQREYKKKLSLEEAIAYTSASPTISPDDKLKAVESFYKLEHDININTPLTPSQKLDVYLSITVPPITKPFIAIMGKNLAKILDNAYMQKDSKTFEKYKQKIDDVLIKMLPFARKDVARFYKSLGEYIKQKDPKLSQEYFDKYKVIYEQSPDILKYYEQSSTLAASSELSGHHLRCLIKTAQCAMKFKKYDLAKEYCDKVLDMSPSLRSYTEVINVFRQANHEIPREYIKFFEKQNPNKAAEYLLDMADKRVQLKDRKTAIQYCKEASKLSLEPSLKAKCDIYFLAYSEQDPKLFKEKYRNIINKIQANYKDDARLGHILEIVAFSLRRNKRFDLATELYEQLANGMYNTKKNYSKLVGFQKKTGYLRLAILSTLNCNNVNKAVQYFNKIVNLHKKNGSSYTMLYEYAQFVKSIQRTDASLAKQYAKEAFDVGIDCYNKCFSSISNANNAQNYSKIRNIFKTLIQIDDKKAIEYFKKIEANLSNANDHKNLLSHYSIFSEALKETSPHLSTHYSQKAKTLAKKIFKTR